MEQGPLRLTLLLLAGLCFQTARAESLADHLDTARKSLAAGEKRTARSALKQANELIVGGSDVVPPVILAQYWYLVGMEFNSRRRSERAMDAWRKTLLVNPDFEWDVALLEDRDPRRLFEALRGEIRAADEVDVQVPEKTGAATLWVDGRRVRHGDQVTGGPHLLQVVCPDEKVYGAWAEIPGDLDWLAMCPDGVDTAVVVADDVGMGDGLDGMPPAFDDMPVAEEPEPPELPDLPEEEPEEEEPVAEEEEPAAEEEEPVAEEEPAAEETAPEETPSEDASPSDEAAAPEAETPEEGKPAEPAQSAKAEKGPGLLSQLTPRTYALAGGGALFLTGTVTNFALVNPSWAQIESARSNPSGTTRNEAESLSKAFNTYRGVTLGLMGSGMVVAGAGYFLLDAPVQPMVLPGGAGLTGRW